MTTDSSTGDGSVNPPSDSGVVQEPNTSEEGVDAAAPRIRNRFDAIRNARRRRAMGWLGLLVAMGFVMLQGLAATEFFDERTRFTWSHFGDRLGDYFPVVGYSGIPLPFTDATIPLPGSVPFLDLGSYWFFIQELNLIYDPEVGSLLFQWPPNVADIYAFFMEELGMFMIFGEAGVTLSMGLVGTVLGFPLALLFSVLGSERVTPFPFNFIFRGTMSFIRAVPAIIWALIFVALVGLGAAAATIAIAFNTIGNLGRLFVEELEELEEGPIEAMRTTGGSKPQIIFFGMLSQVRTSFIAWTLYIFEINVRSAVTVGVIGAGGLGAVVAAQEARLEFTNMMATLFVIFILIFLVELFSQRLRARLRSDEEKMSLWELVTGFPQRMAQSALK